MTQSTSLLSIIAHARSGALEHAWRLFRDGGLEEIDDDPAVLSVRGRLLKDSALGAKGAERRKFYSKAAEAYARAAAIGGATYPLINAATLSLLAEQREQAQTLARKVLDQTPHREHEPETPYYRAATRAEALLLLGNVAQAKAALTDAIALAPKAFEDHASTLRQFGLILEALGEDSKWLDPCRPPRSVHFAGHMAPPADGGTIERRIRAVIEDERIGFGFGALAAGSDILIAEALVEAGAELHLILPAPIDNFREVSVASFRGNWVKRFDKLVEAADSVRSVVKDAEPLSPLALQLGAAVAMGSAVIKADMLMTEAVQLLILDRNAPAGRAAGGSGWVGSIWKKSRRRQLVLTAPRSKAAELSPISIGVAQNCLAAMLRIDLAGMDEDLVATEILPALARALEAGPTPLISPRWTGDVVLVAFDAPASAAQAALSAAAALEDTANLRIAAHYAIVRRMTDPFGGEQFFAGPTTALLKEIVLSTPSGAIHVSEDFAAALHAGPAAGLPRTEYIGELPSATAGDPVRLFSLKR